MEDYHGRVSTLITRKDDCFRLAPSSKRMNNLIYGCILSSSMSLAGEESNAKFVIHVKGRG